METNQPGLPGFRFSQTLSLIKVAMIANKEQEETIPDDSYQITCTKISQEFKEEVIQKYAQVFTGLGRLEKPLHTEKDPTDTRCNPNNTLVTWKVLTQYCMLTRKSNMTVV